MAFSVESIFRPSPGRVAHRGWLTAGVALGLTVAAGGGATWLLTVGPESPWQDAFADLSSTSEVCRQEGDATAHAAARVAQLQGQLDNFVRHRFDQFLGEAKLVQDRVEREAEARAASQRNNSAIAQTAPFETRLAELNGERSRLLERLTPQHPTVVEVDRQIADLDHQLADIKAAATALSAQITVTTEAEITSAAGWRDLIEHSVVEYDQLAAACRRAERQFEEAQLEHSAALDSHLTAIGRWSDAAAEWGKMLAVPVGLETGLWIVAAAALAVLGWLAACSMSSGVWTGADRLITSADQIERWFSLPVVAISATVDNKPTRASAEHRPASRWLVLPAQLAVAVAVFCLVATTIQNPSWFGTLWTR